MTDEQRGLLRAAQEVVRCMDADRRSRQADTEGFGDLFTKASHRALPPVLLQQYDNFQYKCDMGLFPEIHRAWVAFDNRVFLWKYDDDRDFNMWDGLDQVIVSVGLVPPKPDVFVDTIRYLLVLTTAVEIVVLGVSFASDDVHGEMQLQPTDLSIPSDEVNMLQIVGTPQGRIFMCGSDGHLYELEYSAPGSGWFSSSKHCRKVNHTQGMLGSYLPFLSNLYTTDALQELRFDRSRNTLYALAASSTIQCFWLGRDGKTLERCATRSNLQDDAICRERIHNPASAEFQICSIWPVTAAESSRFHLLALTTSGVRIYLTTMPNPSDKPYTLQVVHVDNALRDLRGSHSAVQASFFAYGCLLLSTSPGGGASLAAPDAERPLYCLHFNTASKEQRTINVDEPYQCLRLSGTTWAIGETPLPAIVAASEIVPTVVPPVNVANELATQHFIQRRFLCLTHRGIYTVERRRPVDQLALCLTQSQGSVDAQELHSFFGSYKSGAEAYAMCLMLACQRPDTPHLASADAGGAAASAAAAGGSGWVGATLQIRDYATSAFLHFEPKGNRAAGAGGANVGVMLGQQQQTSERYQGFCAYLARLLAPVWHVPINRITVYTKEEVRGFRDSLVNLMFFVEQTRWGGGDSVLAGVGGGGGGGGGDGGGRIAGATETPHPFPLRVLDSLHTRTRNQQDQLSLPHLVTLLNRAIQALNMLIVLNEHDVTIIDRLSTDAKITAAPFADLVAGQAGVTIVKLLVGFLMKAYTEETDQMSKDLSRDCPLYFNQADRDYFLAVKRLREAGLQQNHTARVELQEEALKLFRGIAAGLPFADAFAVIAEMQAQGFTAGVVEVAMLACSSREKQRPADKDDRLRCCAVIEDAFETLLSRLAPSEQGLLARVAPDAPWAEPAVDLYRRLKRLVLQGGSEECRMHLFGWYLATGKLAELTEVESPLLEAFLRANDPVFLAEYYTANHRYADAATAYLALAEAPTPAGGRDLNQRILYLGHAVANVKQADGRGVSEGQVRLLTEKLEVATIQRRIYNELQSSVSGAGAPLAPELERLNQGLFSISELYNQFAWPLQLWETCLMIMYTANHECPRTLVDTIWTSIVHQERRLIPSRSVAAAVSSLSRKVENVARFSALSPKVFPVETICKLLEQLSFEMLRGQEGFDDCWVARLLLGLDISHNTLFDLYHLMFASLDGDRKRQLHFSSPLRHVLERWVESSVGTRRRLPAQVVDDVILRLEEYLPAQDEVRAWKVFAQRIKGNNGVR